MDYTKVPRVLIYKNRKDLDEFPVADDFDFQSLEEVFLDHLEDRPFIKEAEDAPELILKIFNNARYITTLICMENHPQHYLRRYMNIAAEDSKNISMANHVMPATMALVWNYLNHYFTCYNSSKIVEAIYNNFNTVEWKELTVGGQNDFYDLHIIEPSTHPRWTTDGDFEPREIMDVINDPEVHEIDIANGLDYIIREIFFKLDGKEIPCAINIVKDSLDFLKSIGTSGIDSAYNKLNKACIQWEDEHSDEIEIVTEETTNAPIITEQFHQLETRIAELEEENERLKEKIKELEEFKQLLDTPLDAIEADSKVGLTEILKLMENDGANFTKSKNKTIAAKALKMMTGRSDSACKQIFSVPLSPTYSGHKKKISELNGYLEALGMKTLL
ncbi:MAG: hypothetical protein J5732_10120 [Bacteroidaceae bacterium]|nr:hypothetical protein [Bacteroidaceae bacterium]